MTSAVVVGSGPNGLAAALPLARAGLEVTVLEQADHLGGGVRSSELTVPGLIHDECSAAHPLAVDTPLAREFDLGAHGLTWRWAPVECSHPLDGGRGAAAWRSLDETAAQFPGLDPARWRAAFGPLAAHFGELVDDLLQPAVHAPAHPLAMGRFGALAALPAGALVRLWRSDEAQALLAGFAAHAWRPFSSPMSSAIAVTFVAAAHHYGWPVAEGGSQAIGDALISAGKALGVRYDTGVEVTSLAELDDHDVVLLDVAPSAAARLAGDRMPPRIARALRRFRHGPAAFKVDLAVDGGVPWTHEPSQQAGTVHVGGSAAEIARAERDVARGRMPSRPYVLVCQQAVADPTRARGDVQPLYAYAHVPSGWTGDATEAIEEQIERFAPGFRERIVGRHVRNVAGMAAHNPNFIGGDPVTGANTARQLVFRPRVTLHPYDLGVPGTYLCSAATPPGAGAHGMCGYHAAWAALRDLGVRVAARSAG